MASRTGAGARRSQSQSEGLYELGKQGRRTGITIRDTGARDEHGMQPLDAIFSSPEKTAPVNMNGARTPSINGAQYSDDDDDSDELPMDIENTTAPDPARMMNGIKFPLPRARSPVKTFLQSPAQKNPHLGPSSSPVRGSIVEQRAREDLDRGQSPKRRLNFGMNGSSSGPVLKPTRTSPRTTHKSSNLARDEEEEDEESILRGQDHTANAHEESIAMVDVGEDDVPILGDDDDVELGEESRDDSVAQIDTRTTRRPIRRSGRFSESLLEDERAGPPAPEPEPEPQGESEEEEEPPAQPSPMPVKKRGRPAGKPKAVEEQEPAEEDESQQRATKRRRSNNAVEEELAVPASRKPVGRPRGRPPGAAKQAALPTPSPTVASAIAAQKPKGKRGRPPKTARRSESPAAGADTSLAVVPRGPPLPKSRGLLISRRVEVPGSNDGILRTRSGRNSFRPLAFWRNEHVDYDQDAVVDDPLVRGKGKSSKVLLPTVKEIVRVEQEEAPVKKKSGYRSKTSISKSKHSSSTSSNPFFDDEPADAWEEDPGTFDGDAIVWQTEYDWAPPTLQDEVEVESEQLAISGRAIQTREIRNASFRFAKTLSMPFFGAGVVDLPPGAEKRPKNSRKMYMAFFVFAGSVLVTINQSSFRIGRGGMWFVPRGNTYSIENDYDEPARIFFSQGCEMPPRAEEEEGEVALESA